MNIIYIEDNEQDRTLVERYLSTTPHTLITASTLEDLDLRTISIDLILLDILIDGKRSGLEYVNTIREQGIDCPVIVVTALTLPHQIAGYKKAGVDAVIEKPFEISQLAEIISYYA